MRVPSSRRPPLDNDSMTPMIDVVFLLLVFFVCASIGQKPDFLLPADLAEGTSESDVELPPADPTVFESETVTVQLQRNTAGQLQLRMNDRPLTGAADLQQRLKTLAEVDSGTKIVLDPTDDVSVQQFIAVYDLCQSLKFDSISFAVRKSSP